MNFVILFGVLDILPPIYIPPYDVTVHYPMHGSNAVLDRETSEALEETIYELMGVEAQVVPSAVHQDYGLDIHTYLSLTEMARVHCLIHDDDPPPCLPQQCLALAAKTPGCFELASDPETFTLFTRPVRIDIHTDRPLVPCSHCESK